MLNKKTGATATIFVCLVFGLYIEVAEFGVPTYTPLTNDEKYELGRQKYEEIVRDSKAPRYSECWTNALQQLEVGCKQLTDDVQHRLAIVFTNCFHKRLGRPTYECTHEYTIQECTVEMTSDALGIYAQFFTHTQNICFFLQAQMWQEHTEGTINRLSDASQQMITKTEYSSSLQEEMIQKQLQSISQSDQLRTTIEQSSGRMLSTVEDFKLSMGELFERVQSLQNLMVGEVTSFYAIIYYTCAVVVCYLITATPRTADARLWMIAVVIVNIVVERMIVSVGTPLNFVDTDGTLKDGSILLYQRILWCRRTFIFVAFCLFAWCCYRYQDINAVNNKMLSALMQEICEVRKHLQGIDMVDNLTQPTTNRSDEEVDCVEAGGDNKRHNRDSGVHETSILSVDHSSDSDTSSSDTDSDATDHTFIPDHAEDFSDDDDCSELDESFMTTYDWRREDRDTTPALLDELRDLRSATPLREMTPLKTSGTSPSTPTKRRGRPKKGSAPMKNKGDSQSERNGVVRYNLRRAPKKKTNPEYVHESVKQFSRIVKQIGRIAQQQSPPNHHHHTNHPNFFSSDEE